MTTIADCVNLYRSWGISFQPIFPRTKQPCLPKWKELAVTAPTDEQVNEWLITYWNPQFWRDVWEGRKAPALRTRWIKALEEDWTKAGVGDKLNDWSYDGTVSVAVIGSRESGLLLCDIEDISLLTTQDQEAITGTEYETTVIKTGKPHGHHIWFKVPGDAENKKGPNGEIRANGQYVVAPPSVHPNGSEYTFVKKFEPKAIDEKQKGGFLGYLRSLIGADSDAVLEFAKTIIPVKGYRSDWLVALTAYFKPLGKDAALAKLRQIPVAAEPIQEKGTDWWETHEFNKVDGCSLGLFLAAARKSGVEIPQNILNAINNADGVYSRPKIKITNDRSKMIKVVLDL